MKITNTQLAKYLRVSTYTVERMTKKGIIPVQIEKKGKLEYHFYERDEVLEIIIKKYNKQPEKFEGEYAYLNSSLK